ncbi:hypothetical protein ICW40_12295 [Actinotalea ferrariae]|uniref:hypothetical protein n=1 Tax=Actinotalea ferrariae TaxID=1386098 RepID=UPI001C8B322A|nr:hypothetical protein [Actinotalea ferrariae]MBX9245582.1 hypothetical protein [Actinotalea ferrariae]
MSVYGYGPSAGVQQRVGPPRVELVGPPVPHQPWSTVVIVLNGLGILAGVVTTGAGIALAVADSSASSSQAVFAGLGMMIAAVITVVGLAVLAVAVLVTVLTVRGRRAAERGRSGQLLAVAIIHVALGASGVLGPLSSGDVSTALMGSLPPVLYGLPGVMLLRLIRSATRPLARSGPYGYPPSGPGPYGYPPSGYGPQDHVPYAFAPQDDAPRTFTPQDDAPRTFTLEDPEPRGY